MTVGAALALGPLLALAAADEAPGKPSPSPPPSWELSAALSAYLLNDQPDFLQPTVAADHGHLHLEGRYNYEDIHTGSLFVGANHQLGETLTLELTPMLGAAFGRTNGMVLALELALRWSPLELTSEAEYLVDAGTPSASFFYSWTEATVGLWSWARVGVGAQRTKTVFTASTVAAGPMAKVSLGRFEATVYWFDPFAEGQFVVITVGAAF
jgi:hypothetical protein